MGKASLVTLATLIVLLVGGAIGVYAYDSSREDVIADGVTVGGVDLGGMTADEARAALRFEIRKPLEKPIRVSARGERFELSPRQAKVRTDLDAMVDDALAESRDGNVVSRTVRDLTGGTVDAEIPARVRYSRAAVDELVTRVQQETEQEAQDAEVVPSGGGLRKVAARTGIDVGGEQLTQDLVSELESPTHDRRVKAVVRRVKPEVTQGELANRYPHYLTVDRGSFTLNYYRDLELVESYTIAVGRVGFDTPSGLYEIQNKAVDPAWSVPEWGGRLAGQVIPGGTAQNPLKERWLGIYDGAGIHGTDDVASLGTAASHGCIRMAIPEVIELYDRVPVGAPIYIQ